MQFLPKQRSSWGESIGNALNYLAEQKLHNMYEKKQFKQNADALEALGYSPENAARLAPITGPDIFKEIFKGGGLEHLGATGTEGSGGSEAYNRALQSLYGGNPATVLQEPEYQQSHIPQERESVAQRSIIKNVSQSLNPEKNPEIQREAKKEKELQAKQEKSIEKQEKAAEKQTKVAEKEAQILPKVLQETVQQPSLPPALQQIAQQALEQQKTPAPVIQSKPIAPVIPQKIAGINTEGLTPAQVEKLIKFQQQKEAQEEKKQSSINKTEKPTVDKITAYKEAADDAEKRLNKMEKLVKKGSLPFSGFYNILKTLEENVTPIVGSAVGGAIGGALGLAGGPLAPASATAGSALGAGIGGAITPVVQAIKSFQRGVTSTDTEEFEKLSNDFVKNAKSIFGSRITDADLKAFMSTVPSLSQTDAGKLAIIKNMRSFNEAAQVRYKSMRDIIRENDNKIPANLEFMIAERAKPELDKLADKFID